MGLEGVKGGYKGLQRVTKRLETVTWGYSGLQGVTGGYRK